jgi:hypothetical protein
LASIVAECAEAGVPCFVKQLGANVLKEGIVCPKTDKKGSNMGEWPEAIRVREMPLKLAA